jgi:hypothetical protein
LRFFPAFFFTGWFLWFLSGFSFFWVYWNLNFFKFEHFLIWTILKSGLSLNNFRIWTILKSKLF